MMRSRRGSAPAGPGLASLAFQRLAPAEGLWSAQIEGDVLGGSLRPVEGAPERAGDDVALGLADGEEARHDLGPRRIVDAAGIALRHHVLAERAAQAVDHARHLDPPVLGIVRDRHRHELHAVEA